MGNSKRGSECLDYDEPSKRPRHSSNVPSKGATQGRIDPTYGQRSAFPGLDEDGGFAVEDEDLDYEEDVGALSYLRTVRSEAAGIPTLLVAPRPILEESLEADRSIYDDGVGDSRGFYSDGAYTAAPDPSADVPVDIPPTRQLQAEHFEKILNRFRHLRSQLSNAPPRHAVERLDKDHDSYMSPSAADYRKWRWRLINTEPTNVQLAGMDRSTLLRLLRLFTNDKLAMGSNALPSERTSRWIWGLLARLPDGGEMNSEEIGLVRDLGKRAVWLGVVMSQPDSDMVARMPGDDQDNEGGDDECDEINEDIERGDVLPNLDSEERVVLVDQVGDNSEISTEASHTNHPVSRSGPACFGDTPTIEDEAMHDDPKESSAWQTADLATLQTETYDSVQENEEGIAIVTLGLVASKNSLAAVAGEPHPDKGQSEEETLELVRQRVLAKLGETAERNAVELAQSQDAMKARDLKEQAHENGKDAARILNARATVDMIITVVGEIYGQRDLLEFRETWD